MSPVMVFDPCPSCGRAVENVVTDRGDDWPLIFDSSHVLQPADIYLAPCGDRIKVYEVRMPTDRVAYVSFPGVEWKVSP